MLIERLILGCGHLTGGASQAEATRIVERARAAGITHFDTAPSYGIGTAEAALGRALRGDTGVRITAKIGSRRPAHALLKTYARRALRMVRGARHGGHFAPPEQRPASGCFDRAFMEASFAASLKALRRDAVDVLLLHEAFAEDITPDVQAFLEAQRIAGRAAAIGYSNGMAYDPALHVACPPEWIAQTAPVPTLLTGATEAPARPVIFHSLIKTTSWLRRTDVGFAAGAAAAEAKLGGAAGAYLLPYVLIASRAPKARLIYATSVPERLDGFLRAAATIDAGRADEARAAFDAAHAQTPR